MNAARAVPARSAIDHLLLGTADLDKGIAWLEQLTGVRAVAGGSHPGRGTRNALLSLGGRQYIEIIAPDPAQKTLEFKFELRKLEEPRLVSWAAGTTDLDALAKRARDAGQQVLGPRDGSRKRPDGKMLEWRTLGAQSTLAGALADPIPFFIEWRAGTTHPAEDSPRGGELQSFAIAHPTPSAVLEVLGAFGIEAEVTTAKEPALAVTLKTAKGMVEIG